MSENMYENNANAPLDLIRSKERELVELIKDAENRAKEKLAAAQARAKAIRHEAEITGPREAEQFFHDEMTRAQQAAAAINDAGRREAEQLTRRGEKHLDRAEQIVIDFIFPK
jgi:vacuolar-type H+-ATPase subunit H